MDWHTLRKEILYKLHVLPLPKWLKSVACSSGGCRQRQREINATDKRKCSTNIFHLQHTRLNELYTRVTIRLFAQKAEASLMLEAGPRQRKQLEAIRAWKNGNELH